MRVSKSSPAPFGKILQRAHAGQPVELYQPASCIYRERAVNRVVHIIELFRQWCFIFLNSHTPTLIALNLKMRGEKAGLAAFMMLCTVENAAFLRFRYNSCPKPGNNDFSRKRDLLFGLVGRGISSSQCGCEGCLA